ncbi:response regulator transcription factor [Ruminococcaceae bacterium OttesenSCG-928-L11]|nr:response regulator transcription factor [Ruminococcaceae bacterium OttesenSCG-928-L11]
MKILLVEDDALIASGLEYALTQEGYAVMHCGDLLSARDAIRGESLSLAILDLGLPDGDGFSLFDALRERGIPFIVLTALDDEASAVRGLETGAEDYITKPFRLRELLARVKAVLRRRQGAATPVIEFSPGLCIHLRQAKVFRHNQELALTALEYRLLLVLVEHRGQVLSRSQLLDHIWDGAGNFVEDNTLTVYIRRLREKLGDDSQNPEIIKTVRGMGYRID